MYFGKKNLFFKFSLILYNKIITICTNINVFSTMNDFMYKNNSITFSYGQ